MKILLNKFLSNELTKEAEKIRLSTGNRYSDLVVTDIYRNTEELVHKFVKVKSESTNYTKKIDNIITSRVFGYPIMLLMLCLIFWITISGANKPSEWLASVLFGFQDVLSGLFQSVGAPDWLHGLLVLGLYRTMAWVISVFLPPMAIFFPLFTIMEDLGYLPRIAFNLDHLFKKAKACGKQSLSMCMGLGCNAVGVISCRIIDSPRERLIAILTNNFVPCNGRFPTIIAIGTIFGASALAPGYQTIAITGIITALILVGILMTFLISWLLSKTILKGEPSSMVLELPPYRRPSLVSIIYRSIIDRTLFVLRRGIFFAAPAGALTWVLSNYYIGDLSITAHAASFLEPLANSIGLDGYILMAFILGIPANEIVLPILIMNYISSGYMIELNSLVDLGNVLIEHGWTWLTAINTMLFSILHWPCATTLMTMHKETGSKKWTFLAFIIPTSLAFTICFILTQIVRLLNLV